MICDQAAVRRTASRLDQSERGSDLENDVDNAENRLGLVGPALFSFCNHANCDEPPPGHAERDRTQAVRQHRGLAARLRRCLVVELRRHAGSIQLFFRHLKEQPIIRCVRRRCVQGCHLPAHLVGPVERRALEPEAGIHAYKGDGDQGYKLDHGFCRL